MGSFLAAEDRPFRKNTGLVLKFLGGRLAGYLCFGIVLGYLGEKFDSRWLRLVTDISFIFLSILLLLYLTGLSTGVKVFMSLSFPRKRESRTGSPTKTFGDDNIIEHKKDNACVQERSNPCIMGFLMGLNLCPPFLLSMAYVLSRHSILYGAVYFALFFLSSSIYFLPLVFIGGLSKAAEFRKLARWSGFVVGILFLVYGIYSIFHNLS